MKQLRHSAEPLGLMDPGEGSLSPQKGVCGIFQECLPLVTSGDYCGADLSSSDNDLNRFLELTLEQSWGDVVSSRNQAAVGKW